jgi:hypothetical protein
VINWFVKPTVVVLLCVLVTGCKEGDTKALEKIQITVTDDVLSEYSTALTVDKRDFDTNIAKKLEHLLTAEWSDLIPEEELLVLLNPPEYLNEIDDGSLEDYIPDKLKNTHQGDLSALSSYEQALVSSNTIAALHGVTVRIPGFVVPLEINEQQVITRFFVVPYFGACIHLPPPAPNQMIHVETKQGIELESIYEPIWISGKLSTTLIEDNIATSAYSMDVYAIERYEERG